MTTGRRGNRAWPIARHRSSWLAFGLRDWRPVLAIGRFDRSVRKRRVWGAANVPMTISNQNTRGH